MGVTSLGVVLGRAYSSPSSAIAFTADIINYKILSVKIVDWYGSGSQYQWPTKMNENGMGSGSVKSGNQRWLNYESVTGTAGIDETVRHKKSSTTYNTYGQDINDNLVAVGYYFDGSERLPFVYTMPAVSLML
ncbi:MAG: hypothetical protein ACI8SE_001180 [Bacteroidia bacterium]